MLPSSSCGPRTSRRRERRMDACTATTTGESTDGIVMDESTADERDMREAFQRCVLFLFLK